MRNNSTVMKKEVVGPTEGSANICTYPSIPRLSKTVCSGNWCKRKGDWCYTLPKAARWATMSYSIYKSGPVDCRKELWYIGTRNPCSGLGAVSFSSLPVWTSAVSTVLTDHSAVKSWVEKMLDGGLRFTRMALMNWKSDTGLAGRTGVLTLCHGFYTTVTRSRWLRR